MRIAFVHEVSPHIGQCELTYRKRKPISYHRAAEQHLSYIELLKSTGFRVIILKMNRALPDSVFIEDTAVILDEVAIIARMGASSRLPETKPIKDILQPYRPLAGIKAPATLEGGDILQVGRSLLAGLSPRTNQAGIDNLRAIAEPLGYTVHAIVCTGCLHFKSACTALDDRTLLINPEWIDTKSLSEFECIPVPAEEPWAANVLRVGGRILAHSGFTETIQMIRSLGYEVLTCDISELLKAEAGMTCSSLIVKNDQS